MVNAEPLNLHTGNLPDSKVKSLAPPVSDNTENRQSVEYPQNWYVIRATMGRAAKIATQLSALKYQCYLPVRKFLTEVDQKGAGAVLVCREELVSRSLLFVRCTESDMAFLVKESGIIGLTPYYNHFERNRFGRDKYLVVPDRQMESFMTILNSENQNVLVRFNEPLRVAEGQRVRVTDGDFAGVEGIVMRIAGQRRVVVELKGIGFVATAFVPTAFIDIL